jgi:hypothetical protein
MIAGETGHEAHKTTILRSQHSDPRWLDACERFLRSVSIQQREAVAHRLAHPNNGGSGLRDWVAGIAWRGAMLPEQIPESIIRIYLSDSEAAPLFDCEGCGMLIPVRPSRFDGWEGEPDEVYFATCPSCKSRTGQHLYFTRNFESKSIDPLRRRPR